MLFSVEQAFLGSDERRAPLKSPAWEATKELEMEFKFLRRSCKLSFAPTLLFPFPALLPQHADSLLAGYFFPRCHGGHDYPDK